MGVVTISSIGGGLVYFVSFIDDFSMKVLVYFIEHKSEVFDKFKQWKTQVEKQTRKQVKYLQTDNGLEYRLGEFLRQCKTEGISRHFTTPGVLVQNSVAKRMNRTLLKRARCMRIHTGLPKSFWVEVVNMAYYLVNRSPSLAIGKKVPEEVWTSSTVGCPDYVHVQEQQRPKLDPNSKVQTV